MYLTATLTSTIIITFIVLITGIVLFVGAGILTGSLTYASALNSMGSGMSGMFETMIVTILVAANIAQITSVSIIPYLIYPYVLIVFIAAQIIREK
ncbi:MAG: hypothetical protein IJI23_03600 [Lachnospiraceae bacterium]|nr:hypothetical protein [Lachnospiraceae bacterium]